VLLLLFISLTNILFHNFKTQFQFTLHSKVVCSNLICAYYDRLSLDHYLRHMTV